MYIFTQPLYNEHDVTQGKFSTGVKLVWIYFSFYLDCYLTKTKELSFPIIYQYLRKNRWIPKWISMKSNVDNLF